MITAKTEAARLFDEQRLRAAMETAGLNAVVAHSKRNFYYLSGFPSLDYLIDAESANFVVVPCDPTKQAAVTVPMSERMTLRDVPVWVPQRILCGNFYIKQGPAVDGLTAPSTWEGLLLAIREAGLAEGRIGFELELLPQPLHRRLQDACPQLEILDCSPLIRDLRMVKTSEEVRRIRFACEATEQAIDEAMPQVHPGMTERDVARKIATGMVERGAEVLYVQVATPAAAGLGGPSDRAIEKGDVVRADVAAVYLGYHSDLGRGFAVGSATQAQKEYYRIAREALRAGIAAVQIDEPVELAFRSAMAVWERLGHPEVRRHHVGHGIGLQAHEAPMIRPGTQTRVEAGMVLAVEVPCYIYGEGGFAPEDNLVVTPDRNILFTNAPVELPVI